jgi:hypothetical protein
MGLYISHLDSVTIGSDRSLYLYLLDYGWPDGQWEQIFKLHFMKMADLASKSGAVVIGSMRGVHFANEVLNYYTVGDLNADEVLPAIMITKHRPEFFKEESNRDTTVDGNVGRVLIIPLRDFCKNEEDFVVAIQSIFDDLKSQKDLHNFKVSKNDVRLRPSRNAGRFLLDAVELKPGAFGFSVNIKRLLGLDA